MASMNVRVVTAAGDEFYVDVDADATVGDLAAAIAEDRGLASAEVRLGSGGEEWGDRTAALCDLGWDPDEAVDLIALARPFFEVGQRLEARDRLTRGYLCVATIAEVDGRRVKIHFDGWTERYDYWTNDDHIDLAPVGTCAAKGYFLERPRGYATDENPPNGNFLPADWERYLAEYGYAKAPKECFADVEYFSVGAYKEAASRRLVADPSMARSSPYDDPPAPGTTQFEVGQVLEARDRRNRRLWCAAFIKGTDGRRVCISFLGWRDAFDYMALDSSPDLAPAGLQPGLERPRGAPPGWTWDDVDAPKAPAELFTEDQRRPRLPEPGGSPLPASVGSFLVVPLVCAAFAALTVGLCVRRSFARVSRSMRGVWKGLWGGTDEEEKEE